MQKISRSKLTKLIVVTAPSLVQHVLRINRVNSDTQAERLSICAGCPSQLAQPCTPGGKRFCCGGFMQAVSAGPGCGCVLKILSASKRPRCPQGHWPV